MNSLFRLSAILRPLNRLSCKICMIRVSISFTRIGSYLKAPIEPSNSVALQQTRIQKLIILSVYGGHGSLSACAIFTITILLSKAQKNKSKSLVQTSKKYFHYD
ncbi:hypothetical protein V6Z11_D01G256800 [Gossypium hirsutum]